MRFPLLFSLLCCTVAFQLPLSSFAAVRLPAVFADNMVLQRESEVPIWGWADSDESISVKGSWQIEGAASIADNTGKWMVRLQTPNAGGPHEIVVKGSNVLTIKNVLIGEVWFCSGQSNMWFPVQSTQHPQSHVINAATEVASAQYPEIRLFTVQGKIADEPQEDCVGEWKVCSPETVADFSAVAYFFGRELHRNLGVPVGLMSASSGGSREESWTPKEALESDSYFEPLLQRMEKALANYPEAKKKFDEEMEQWKEEVRKASSAGQPLPVIPHAPLGPHDAPGAFYNGMVAPIVPFRIRGVIWYQGEANADRAVEYRRLFPTLINAWRDQWGQPRLPFYYVQIAPWNHSWYRPQTAADLREAQRLTLTVPNTGMVVTWDIGDVANVHPKNKQDVGIRLALWALAKTYGKTDIAYSGPIYRSMRIEGNKIRIFFDFVGGGLLAKGDALTHFRIAGKDRVFMDATATIEGDTVVVSHPDIAKPVAVRFAFTNDAVPNLFNKTLLPASPFRTDDWQLGNPNSSELIESEVKNEH